MDGGVDLDACVQAAPEPSTNGPIAIGASLQFNNVVYTVKKAKDTRRILRGISGKVKNGEILCILGPSGSGKTSFIQILCRRLLSGNGREVTGEVLCNGKSRTASEFQRVSGLVTQEDVFNGVLTVAETLKFAAMLKLPAKLRQVRVDKVVEQLQLEKCLKTYIGDDSNPGSKGISGGEKRRLAIAVEILNPDISMLVLDEPTSGLDAAAALIVANLLRTLADTGITVATTLHQPRALIMQRFQKLMVLDSGRRVYYGSINQYVPYLQGDLQCEVPVYANPYDLLLDALNPSIGLQGTVMRALPDNCADMGECLADLFDKSSQAASEGADDTMGEDISGVFGAKAWTANWLTKYWTVLYRTFLIKMRDPIVLMTQISSAIMLGLIFGVLYWKCYDRDDMYVILDTQMAVTMCVIMVVFLPYDVTLTFPKERRIFLRERKSGLYSTSAFYFARISADMPMHVLASAIMAIILWAMAGLQVDAFTFIGINVAGVLVGAALMQMVGALSSNFEEANLLMMLIMMLSMVMTTGFVRDVPDFLDWLRQISVMGILADLAMYYEFKDIDPKYGTSDEVLSEYAVRVRDSDDCAVAFLILLAIYVFARVVTYAAVKFMHTGRSFAENLRD